MLSFIPGFEKFPEIDIDIKPISKRKCAIDKTTGEKINQYALNDDISGTINIKLNTAVFEHQGISIELIGAIVQNDISSEFMNLSKEIEPPCEINKSTSYDFLFKKVELTYESYEGVYVSVRYMIRLTLYKKFFGTKKTIEKTFTVINPNVNNITINPELKIEIGKEDLLLNFHFYQSKFHLKDCLLGKLTFEKINFKMKSLELQIIRKETLFNSKVDNSLISKFELVDGNPVTGDIIPIRMFLGSYELYPTYMNINNIFSLRFFLKIVLIDDDDKYFYKQQEIILWRKGF